MYYFRNKHNRNYIYDCIILPQYSFHPITKLVGQYHDARPLYRTDINDSRSGTLRKYRLKTIRDGHMDFRAPRRVFYI